MPYLRSQGSQKSQATLSRVPVLVILQITTYQKNVVRLSDCAVQLFFVSLEIENYPDIIIFDEDPHENLIFKTKIATCFYENLYLIFYLLAVDSFIIIS